MKKLIHIHSDRKFISDSERYAGEIFENRLINITKELGGITYMHPIGGKEIFKKDYLESLSIKLNFIMEPTLVSFHELDFKKYCFGLIPFPTSNC